MAKDESTAIVKTVQGFKGLVSSAAFQQSLADVLPRHITPERMAKLALVAVNRTPLLLQCTQFSLMEAVMHASTYGLDCSGLGGRGYLIPYRNKKGYYEAQFIPGYRGLMDVARRSGMVQGIWAEVVYEDDVFSVQQGTERSIAHTPNYDGDRSDKKIKGAYACAQLVGNGPVEWRYMPRSEIDKVKDKSLAKMKNKSMSPWTTDYAAMCRKTPLRRLCNDLPQSAEIVGLMELDKRAAEDVAFTVQEPAGGDLVDKLTGEVTGGNDAPPPEAADPPEAAAPEPEEAPKVHGTGGGHFDEIICSELGCENVTTDDNGKLYPEKEVWCGSAKRCPMVQGRNKKNPEASND